MMAQMTAADIQRTYAEGLALQNAGNADGALKVFGGLVSANPKIAEAHFQIARILAGLNRFDQALPYAKEAVRLRPNETAVWFGWSDVVALGGRPEDEAELVRVLRSAPMDAQLKITLQDRFGARRASTRPQTGGVKAADMSALVKLMSQGNFSEAERAASRLAQKYPNSAVVLNILGTAQATQGRAETGIQSLRRAIQIDPGYAEAYDNLGRILLDIGRAQEATTQFRRAICLAPGLLPALVNFSTSLTRAGDPAPAVRLLERALAGGADRLPCYLALGNAHTRLKNYKKAEEAFEKALSLSASNPSNAASAQTFDALGLLAQAQARLGKDDLAMVNFDKALVINDRSAVATVGKASLLQALGRFDEAETYFRRAFELDPTNGENYRNFIASHKTKPGDPLIARMQELYTQPELSDADRVGFAFAIAKALEDTKEHDQLFRYLNDANGLMRKAYPYDIATRYREVEQTLSAFEGFDWHNAKIPGTTEFAPIFVTGMPRSGTTLIEQIIASHSQVMGAGEVGEASRAAQLLLMPDKTYVTMEAVSADAIAALGHDYEAYIRARFPDVPYITDKSIQTYMYIGLMKLAMPNARFIVVRRDPRDTLLSIYKNKFPDDTHAYAYDQRDLALYYKTFVEMIDFWRSRVPDWFYEVEYEAVVANPEEESRKLIAACGLEWEDACLNFHQNTRKVETLSLFQVRQPISGGSVKGWKRHEKDLQPMLETLRELGLVTD